MSCKGINLKTKCELKCTGAAASCKTQFILALVGELVCSGHRVLIFSQSRLMLDILAGELSHPFLRIDGFVTSAEERQVRCSAAPRLHEMNDRTSVVKGSVWYSDNWYRLEYCYRHTHGVCCFLKAACLMMPVQKCLFSYPIPAFNGHHVVAPEVEINLVQLL